MLYRLYNNSFVLVSQSKRGRRGRDRIGVGFTTTYAINTNVELESHSGEVSSIQHYVIVCQ